MAGTRSGATGGAQETGRERSRETTDIARWLALGVGTFLLIGLGTVLSFWLYNVAAPNEESLAFLTYRWYGMVSGGESELFGFAISAMMMVMQFSAVFATGLGLYVGQNVGEEESAPAISAIINGVGVVLVTIVLIVLMLIYAPEGTEMDDILNELIRPLLGLAVGVGITGGLAAGLSDYVTS